MTWIGKKKTWERRGLMRKTLKLLLLFAITLSCSFITFKLYSEAESLDFTVAFMGGAVTVAIHEIARMILFREQQHLAKKERFKKI